LARCGSTSASEAKEVDEVALAKGCVQVIKIKRYQRDRENTYTCFVLNVCLHCLFCDFRVTIKDFRCGIVIFDLL
jgi:hypothetical protein